MLPRRIPIPHRIPPVARCRSYRTSRPALSTHPITRLEAAESAQQAASQNPLADLELPASSSSEPPIDASSPLSSPASSSSASSSSVPHPPPADMNSNLPVPLHAVPAQQRRDKPPFNTHAFILSLAQNGGFSEGMSKGLMLIAQELIRSREKMAMEGTISRGDLENQAYLFRAALAELRAESAARGRTESAAIRASLAALRREVDVLNQKLKEDVDTLKHEIQMEMNNRKSESRMEIKVADVAMEDLNHKSILTMGELRTEIEQAKWNNTRRGVGVIAFFVIFIIASVELMPAPKPKLPVVAKTMGGVGTGTTDAGNVVQLDIRELERDDR